MGRERKRASRGATCEKIFSWHSASADDEINSVRGCGSAMSTDHTSRFERIEQTEPQNREETRIRGRESARVRQYETGGDKQAGAKEKRRKEEETRRCYRDEERVLTHVLSASTTF